MTDIAQETPNSAVNGSVVSRGEAFAPYEYAVDQQALAFHFSVLTQDFTFFHVLHAQDISSRSNPGADLISINPDLGPKIIDELLSYSNTTIESVQDSFQAFVRKWPPVFHQPLPEPGGDRVPQIAIQDYNTALTAAVNESASKAKLLIKDLPNDPARQAAAEVWARGLREIVSPVQYSVQVLYASFNSLLAVPDLNKQTPRVDHDLPLPGTPPPVQQNAFGDFFAAIGAALIAAGQAIQALGNIFNGKPSKQ